MKGIEMMRSVLLVVAMAVGTAGAWAQGSGSGDPVEPTASGTCGESTANGGNNVVWRLYDMDGDNTPETLVIAPSETATAETNFKMDDWAWDNASLPPSIRRVS